LKSTLSPVGMDIRARLGVAVKASPLIFSTIHPFNLAVLRAGPDLANVGARLPDANWPLVHLYARRRL